MIFGKNKKSDFIYLNRIMIYIRIFHFLLGQCSYNYHNYVNDPAELDGTGGAEILFQISALAGVSTPEPLDWQSSTLTTR